MGCYFDLNIRLVEGKAGDASNNNKLEKEFPLLLGALIEGMSSILSSQSRIQGNCN